MIDFSDLNNDMKVVLIGYMFYLLGVTYMVMKYKSYQEPYSTNRKRITTKELLKNMPIDRMQLWIFITKKKIKTMCSNDGDNNSHKNNNNIGSL